MISIYSINLKICFCANYLAFLINPAKSSPVIALIYLFADRKTMMLENHLYLTNPIGLCPPKLKKSDCYDFHVQQLPQAL
jgi:hypothetical protein